MAKVYDVKCCQCGCSLKTRHDPDAWIICQPCGDRLSKAPSGQPSNGAHICLECGGDGEPILDGLCDACFVAWRWWLDDFEDAINAGELRW